MKSVENAQPRLSFHWKAVPHFISAVEFARARKYIGEIKCQLGSISLNDLWCAESNGYIYTLLILRSDRLCGLVVRVPDYRWRGRWFDSWRYQVF
jgi:hypothetical protein